jgi:tetratricopeptide (TPR) repeat protein
LFNAEEGLAIVAGIAQEDSFTVATARLYVGRAQLAALKIDDAIRTLDRARASMRKVRGAASPEVATLTALHALALAHNGRIAEAQREIEAEIPGFATAAPYFKQCGLHLAGVVRRMAGDLVGAAELQKQALEALPDSPIHAFQRARVHAELARLARERAEHEQALALLDGPPAQTMLSDPIAPESADWLLTRGRALLALGRREQALATVLRTAAFWRDFAPQSRSAGEAAFWLGRCYAELGRASDAKRAYVRAVEILAHSPLPSDAGLRQRARRALLAQP